MKGVIFNVVQEVVEELFDADTWDDLLDEAAVDGAYTALGDYAAAELVAIVAAASTATGQTPDDVLRLVGYHSLAKLIARVPDSLELAQEPFTFLRQVNDIIHPEVLKIYPQAIPPAFEFADHPDGLIVRYRSARNLPALAEGLLTGVGQVFDVDVTVSVLEPDDDSSTRFLVSIGG